MSGPAGVPAWRIGPDRVIELDRPRLMGILNVTPDSFSDGGRCLDVDDAVRHAAAMVDAGADLVDVGGMSTRPGAAPIADDEQCARVVPVIERLAAGCVAAISIDTTSSVVAEAALDAGARVINDVSAGLEDDRMLDLAATRGCGLVLMHRLVTPARDSYSDAYDREPEYDDVISVVSSFLLDRCREAESRGVDPAAIAVDPGLGFGKTVEQNYELIRRVDALTALGRPVLSAASRKSFIGSVSGVESPDRRLAGSLAIAVAHWLAGVRLFRVHDVASHREALAVAAAVTRFREPASGG